MDGYEPHDHILSGGQPDHDRAVQCGEEGCTRGGGELGGYWGGLYRVLPTSQSGTHI